MSFHPLGQMFLVLSRRANMGPEASRAQCFLAHSRLRQTNRRTCHEEQGGKGRLEEATEWS